MARNKSPLRLSDKQRSLLEKYCNKHSASQSLVCRAEIVLLTHQGRSKAYIAGELGVDDTTVGYWRRRWVTMQDDLNDFEDEISADEKRDKVLMRRIVDILSDAPRSGKPPVFTQDQVEQIVALACEEPEEVGVPISHWTNETLAREAVNRGIVESISSTRVWEILKKYGSPSP